jgi:hypothetical protein
MFFILFPQAHKFTRARIDDRSDVVGNIILLPTFVLKGNCLRRERLKRFADVDLWATCNTDTKARTDKVLYEIKDLFSRGWDIGRVGTLIKGIQDNINWALVWKGEHLLETLHQSFIARLMCAVVVGRVEMGEYVAKGIGTSRKLEKERWKELAAGLLVDISKVEIKIRHRSQSGFAQRCNIVNDCGAIQQY